MTQFKRLAIPDVVEVLPAKHGDHRGFFSEVFKQDAFAAEGITIAWTQDNQSLSATPGTVRGLHLQAPPFAQDKLVRVLRGAIFDVAVDVRQGSPSYGHWVGRELSHDAWNQLLVPAGFAHGFMTLVPDTEVLYKVSAPYSRESEMAIRWDDPDIGIDWPNMGDAVLSAKDADAPLFRDFVSPFSFEVR
jgi:dTDP-4-dehydrorhamnose 3,5-epimerase